MADRFDSFSKQLAQKQTRRGALKLLGAAIFGGIASAFVSREVDAGSRVTPENIDFNACFNGTIGELSGQPCFNQTISTPQWNGRWWDRRRQPRFNQTF